MAPRRFPPPWSVEQQDACFVVRDHNGQQLCLFEEEPDDEIAHAGCGKADCGEYRQVAGATT